MRIVFAIPGLTFGGAERVVSTLANEMVKENEVKIIRTSGDGLVAYDISEKVNLDNLPIENGLYRSWKSFRQKCVAYKADVVLAFMDTVGIMASLALINTGIPVIASERNDPTEKSRKLSGVWRILRKLSEWAISGYVFQSEGAKAYYNKNVQRKSCVILNPLDSQTLPTRNPDKIEKKVVTVGRLHAQKNHMLLIEAFAESQYSNDHTLHIYGDGEMKALLEERISELNMEKRIYLMGNHRDVHEQIKNAELFVFTSDYEGLPNALIEAMAMGIPCISTDCSPGGARMLIDDKKNGRLVPCRDKKALVDAMDEMHKTPAFAQACGKNAYAIRDKLEKTKIAEEWMKWIVCIIEKSTLSTKAD